MLKGEVLLLKQKYQEIKYSAKTRGMTLLLTQDEHEKLIIDACFYCGKLSGFGDQDGNNYFNGIDRVDNEKGYEIGNCVSCCFACNKMKRDLSVRDFLLHIVKIYKQQHSLIEMIEKGFTIK